MYILDTAYEALRHESVRELPADISSDHLSVWYQIAAVPAH